MRIDELRKLIQEILSEQREHTAATSILLESPQWTIGEKKGLLMESGVPKEKRQERAQKNREKKGEVETLIESAIKEMLEHEFR